MSEELDKVQESEDEVVELTIFADEEEAELDEAAAGDEDDADDEAEEEETD